MGSALQWDLAQHQLAKAVTPMDWINALLHSERQFLINLDDKLPETASKL